MSRFSPPNDYSAWVTQADVMYGLDTECDTSQTDYVRRAEDYEAGDYWIRQTHIEFFAGEAELSSSDLLRTTEQHLAVLQKLGLVAIPRREHYFTDISFSGHKTPTLYTMTSHVEGVKLVGAPTEALPALHGLSKTLYAYHEWVAESGQPHALSDITKLKQYIYGTQPGEQTPRTYLVDTDPYLQLVSDPNGDLAQQIVDLKEWSTSLPPLR